MMKKLLAATLLSLSLGAAWSCPVMDSTTENVRDVVKSHGGYPISDAQCYLLKGKSLALSIFGVGTVLNGVNVAWATVTLQDLKSNINSDKAGVSTQVKTGPTSEKIADDILYEAITEALKSLDWDNAIKEVDHYRQEAVKPQ